MELNILGPTYLSLFFLFSFSFSLRSPSPPSKYIPKVIYKSESFYRKAKAVFNIGLIRCISPTSVSWPLSSLGVTTHQHA